MVVIPVPVVAFARCRIKQAQKRHFLACLEKLTRYLVRHRSSKTRANKHIRSPRLCLANFAQIAMRHCLDGIERRLRSVKTYRLQPVKGLVSTQFSGEVLKPDNIAEYTRHSVD